MTDEEIVRAAWSETFPSAQTDLAKIIDEHSRLGNGPSRRHYHDVRHIAECLRSPLLAFAQDARAVRMAIFFHDLVYDPASTTNEERSAERLAAFGTSRAVDGGSLQKARDWILATRDHAAGALDEDGRLLLDIDMSVLGAPAERYDEYTRQIRAEYALAPEVAWRAGRGGFLSSLLLRPVIFLTERGRILFEAQARQNAARELATLQAPWD